MAPLMLVLPRRFGSDESESLKVGIYLTQVHLACEAMWGGCPRPRPAPWPAVRRPKLGIVTQISTSSSAVVPPVSPQCAASGPYRH